MYFSEIIYKFYIGEKPKIEKDEYFENKQKILAQISIWASNGKNTECVRALDLMKEIENENY